MKKTYGFLDAKPVGQVSSVSQCSGEAQEANGQICLSTDVAHAGYNDLQDWTPAIWKQPAVTDKYVLLCTCTAGQLTGAAG